MADFLSTAQQNMVNKHPGILRGGALVAGIEVTVLVSESHTLSAQPTKQAIESGAQVSDHVINSPDSVAIVWEVSNAGEGPQIARDVFETFKKMIEKRALLQLLTEHYTYDNMVVVGLTPMHAAPYKGRLQCTITLQRVNTVKLEIVGRAPTRVKTKTATAQTQGGTQNTEPPKKSYLEKLREKNAMANAS